MEHGIVPEKELLKRRSTSSIGAPITYGSAPGILFPERSKYNRLFGSFGIGPTISLKLTSSICREDNRLGSMPTSRFLDKSKYSKEGLRIQRGMLSCMLVFGTTR